MPASTRPVLPPLQTPKSATFPSEILRSPMPGIAGVMKQEEDLKTPITPPPAYTDFLKALTPVLTSPASDSAIPKSSSSSEEFSVGSTPTTAPSSASSCSFCHCNRRPSLTVAVPPPSATSFCWPPSAGATSARRYRIPQSPLCSPGSARSPLSATAARSPFSPDAWNHDSAGYRYFEAPRSACIRPVSVRSVVTRTVTYKRTPLDPAPKGKKRKASADPEMPPPPSTVTSPLITPTAPATAVA